MTAQITGLPYAPVLEVLRGGHQESVYLGAIAVADPSGALFARWGDASAPVFLRSSAKPIQALPVLETGAAERFGLSDPEIALLCASHTGTDAHVGGVRSMQAKAGIQETDLLCGVHPPYDRETARRLEETGEAPTPNRHNCSGKHTGMLLTTVHMEEPRESYLEPDHPVQQRILQTVEDMAGIGADDVLIATDGCSAPIFSIPLAAAATAFARLADPSGLPPMREAACRRIFAATTGYPEMVSGPGKFDTRLMQATAGRILSKGGAEGYAALALPPGAAGPDSPALGVTVKIADGNLGGRAGPPVVLAALEALGVLGDEELRSLADFGPRSITNHRQLVVGELRACFRLERAEPA